MYNLIPRFICSAYNQQISKGSFYGSIFYIDINNYTNLADYLKKFEFEGTEQLSVILNKIFEKLINTIYQEKGFVSNFAGDSLIVIFKNADINKTYESSKKIRDVFVKNRIIKTSYGDFNLSAKFGLSCGKISWGIVGTEEQKIYYFKGSPINNSIKISQKSQNFQIEIKKRKLKNQIVEYPRKFRVNKKINLNTVKKFFSSSVIKYPYSGEFREVVSVFIGFPQTESYQKINSYSSKLIDIAKIYQGYVNSLEFSDKGPLFLVVFGAPTSYENNLNHALDFALQLDRFLPGTFKISISWGTVYSGILGSKTRCTYTVLGDVVNQAAKALQKISYSEIVVTSPVFRRTKNHYNYSDLPSMFVKGKNKMLKVYKLNYKLTGVNSFKSKNQMVGRREEFDRIIDFFNPSNQINSSKIVLVTGESGIGKSRLCQEIKRNLEDDFNFFYLRGDEVRDDSFFMFKIFFKDYFSISDLDCNEDNLKKFNLKWQKIYDSFADNKNFLSREFVRTKPVLSNLSGLSQQDFHFFDKLQPRVKYLNIISAVKTFFRVVSRKHPLIIIFDDIQWMDKDSKKLFEELMVNIENFPISFIASYRSELENYISDVDIPKNYKILKIKLDKLNIKTISELSKQMFKLKPDQKLLDFLVEKSNGNPFYLEQYAYFLLENNLLKSNKLETSINSENLSIPPTIREILIARIDRLSDHLKELIKNASILGLEFDVNILSSMLDIKLTKEILKEGEQEKVIQSLTELIYIFQHAMIRETIYTMQLKSQLEKLHSKAAKCIANVYPDHGEKYYNIAYHYQKANILELANKYYRLAALYATQNFQNQQAINCYANILKSTTKKINQIELKLKIADIYHQMGNWDKSKAYYLECLNLAGNLKHKQYQSSSYFGLGWVYFRINYNKSLEYFEKSIELADSIEVDNFFYLRLLGSYGLALLKLGKIEQSRQYYQKQLELAKKLQDQKNIAKAIEGLGSISWREGNLQQAKKYFNESLTIFEQLNDILDVQAIYGNLGSIYFSDGDYDRANVYYNKLLKTSFKIGNKNAIAVAYNNIGNIHAHKNNYQKALDYYLKRLEISREIADLKGISLTQGNIGSILYHLGQYQEALKAYQEMKSSCQKIGDLRLVGLASANIARVLINFGKYIEARKLIAEKFIIDKQLNYRQGLAKSFGEAGLINFYLGNYKQAIICNLRRLDLLREIDNKLEISQTHCDLANVYIETGNTEKASMHLANAESILLEKKIKLNLAEFYYVKAMFYYKQQKYSDALDNLKKSSRLLTKIKLYHHKIKNYLLELTVYDQWDKSKISKLIKEMEKNYQLRLVDKIHVEYIKYRQTGNKDSLNKLTSYAEKQNIEIPHNLKKLINRI